MNAMRTFGTVACLLAVATAQAQVKKSGDVVKATAVAGKAEGGKQTVTITLEIDPKYHLYANPVGNPDLESAQTSITFSSGKAKAAADVKFPSGELKKEKVGGDYNIYKGKVSITAVVGRASKDTPLEVSIAVQACTSTTCLQPSTIKLKVE